MEPNLIILFSSPVVQALTATTGYEEKLSFHIVWHCCCCCGSWLFLVEELFLAFSDDVEEKEEELESPTKATLYFPIIQTQSCCWRRKRKRKLFSISSLLAKPGFSFGKLFFKALLLFLLLRNLGWNSVFVLDEYLT